MMQATSERFSKASLSGAYHEAGHAVVARHLGRVLGTASYAERKGGTGCGHADFLPGGVFDAYVAVAGYVAQLKVIGRKNSLLYALAARADYDQLRELLSSYLSRDQLDAYKLKLEDDVAGVLYQPELWEYVCRFGEELLRSGWLRSKQCMKLTEGVPRASPPEIRQTMLDPTLNNHMGRPIGRSKRLELERLLREAVENLRPAFTIGPPLAHIRRLLMCEGYSVEEAERLTLDCSGFWLQTGSPS